MKSKSVYKIIFIQLGEIYEVFANQIFQSDMYGFIEVEDCLLYTSPSPRDVEESRMPSSA